MAKPRKSKFQSIDSESLGEVSGGLNAYRLATPNLAAGVGADLLHTAGGLPTPASHVTIGGPAVAPAFAAPPLATPVGAATDLVQFSANAAYAVDASRGTLQNFAIPSSTGNVTLSSLANQLAQRTNGAIVYGGDLNHDGRIGAADFLHVRGVSEASAAQGVANIMDQLRGYASDASNQNARVQQQVQQQQLSSLASQFQRMMGSQPHSSSGGGQRASQASQASRPSGATTSHAAPAQHAAPTSHDSTTGQAAQPHGDTASPLAASTQHVNPSAAVAPQATQGTQGTQGAQPVPYGGVGGSAYSTTPEPFQYATTGLNGNDARASAATAFGTNNAPQAQQAVPYNGMMGSAFSTTPEPFQYAATGLNGNDARASAATAPTYNGFEPPYAQSFTGQQVAPVSTYNGFEPPYAQNLTGQPAAPVYNGFEPPYAQSFTGQQVAPVSTYNGFEPPYAQNLTGQPAAPVYNGYEPPYAQSFTGQQVAPVSTYNGFEPPYAQNLTGQPAAPVYNGSEPPYAETLTGGGQPAATQVTAEQAQLDTEIASNDYHDYATDLAGVGDEGGTAPV